MLLSICLIFSQFQPGVAYNIVAYKKKRVMYFDSSQLDIQKKQTV